MADAYSPDQLTNLQSHNLMRHSLVKMKVFGNDVVVDDNESTNVIVGCHDCNMGLEEASQNSCPGGDLFDVDQVFGAPTEE